MGIRGCILGIFAIFLAFLFMFNVNAAHFVVGQVNNSYDGAIADGREVVLWNPSNGINDNVTDIIGAGGNSGFSGYYMFDCELLNSPCIVGDTLRASVIDIGDYHHTNFVELTVTGAGFDASPGLQLNSFPFASQLSPVNYVNVSEISTNLICNISDLDGNLENVSIYGDWNGGWHNNGTLSGSGFNDEVTFVREIEEGIFDWACFVEDDLGAGNFSENNYTLTVDRTEPVIESLELNESGNICGVTSSVIVNCTTTDLLTNVDNVLIGIVSPNGSLWNASTIRYGDSFLTEILLDEVGDWEFSCYSNDSAGNIASLIGENLSVSSEQADIYLGYENIFFDDPNPIENQNVGVNLTVFNLGCGDALNFNVSFYEGDPDSSGYQIDTNKTISLLGLGNTSVLGNWLSDIGLSQIYVYADFENVISEDNESNNKVNLTVEVPAWQDFYGNVTLSKLLANTNFRNISLWFNESSFTGNVFVSDSESNVDWTRLLALTRNQTGDFVDDDFSDIDGLLGMNGISDSVSNEFTSNGVDPYLTSSFYIFQQSVDLVPIVNSTINENFVTGILWDSSDDSDGGYAGADKEDIVFATRVNQSSLGGYGFYDYEIKVPARLREYYTSETSQVYFYFDLN